MKINLNSYNWKGDRYQISIPDNSSDFEMMIFNHCCESFHNPERINDTQNNRQLLEKILKCHGFTEVVFLDPLIKPIK